ncbi:MAG: hypothetical protein GX648_05310 [Crenarchaeota archaeon]|jgi:hypothetical protein|nr:hypothetical protein [Thermoproteota archaeon]
MINDKVKYEERHVFYCDILGFSKYTTSNYFEPSKCLKMFHQLDRIIAEAKKEVACPDSSHYVVNSEVIYCSDSITFTTPATNVDAIWLCETAAKIQNLISLFGFILRGSIVTGKIYHSDNTIFGPALIHAVELDKTGAPPAIQVSKETLRIFMDSNNPSDEEIARVRKQQLIFEDNKKYYIDPYWRLKFFADGNLDKTSNRAIDNWRTLIETGLKNKDSKIIAKYDWLAKRFCLAFSNKKNPVLPIEVKWTGAAGQVTIIYK